jgi:hypothetical protein
MDPGTLADQSSNLSSVKVKENEMTIKGSNSGARDSRVLASENSASRFKIQSTQMQPKERASLVSGSLKSPEHLQTEGLNILASNDTTRNFQSHFIGDSGPVHETNISEQKLFKNSNHNPLPNSSMFSRNKSGQTFGIKTGITNLKPNVSSKIEAAMKPVGAVPTLNLSSVSTSIGPGKVTYREIESRVFQDVF